MSVKVYEFYPVAGGFSNQTADYHGRTVAVAATSNDEAHALSERKEVGQGWINSIKTGLARYGSDDSTS